MADLLPGYWHLSGYPSFPLIHSSFPHSPSGLSSIYSCPAGPLALQACCTTMSCSSLEPRPRKSLYLSPMSNPVFSRCCDMLLWGRSLISRSFLDLFPSTIHLLVTSREEGHVRVNVGRPVCVPCLTRMELAWLKQPGWELFARRYLMSLLLYQEVFCPPGLLLNGLVPPACQLFYMTFSLL